MTTTRRFLTCAVAVAAVALVGCGKKEAPVETAAVEEAPAPKRGPMVASAALQGRAGLGISGTVTFTQPGPGRPVTIWAKVDGATQGAHGFHVHEIGDCSAEDFTSAGGHFNPAGVPHAGPDDAERHAGDLGNVNVEAEGIGTLQLTSSLLTVEDGPNSVVGRAVILHEAEDDLMTQPTGAAGSRLACGVIRRES